MAVGSIIARIITQYSDKGSKAAQRDIGKLGKQFDAFANKAVKSVGLVGIALGGIAARSLLTERKRQSQPKQLRADLKRFFSILLAQPLNKLKP